jgi:hypothetical protein
VSKILVSSEEMGAPRVLHLGALVCDRENGGGGSGHGQAAYSPEQALKRDRGWCCTEVEVGSYRSKAEPIVTDDSDVPDKHGRDCVPGRGRLNGPVSGLFVCEASASVFYDPPYEFLAGTDGDGRDASHHSGKGSAPSSRAGVYTTRGTERGKDRRDHQCGHRDRGLERDHGLCCGLAAGRAVSVIYGHLMRTILGAK